MNGREINRYRNEREMMNNGIYFIIFSGLEISLRYSFIVYSFFS